MRASTAEDPIVQSFEDVRSFVGTRYALKDNEPFLISIELPLAGAQRQQSMFLAELEGEDGGRLLRISTPIARLGRVNPEKCLRFNWEQRTGWLAVSDLEGRPYLHLCENRRYAGLSEDELARTLEEMAELADRMEHLLNDGRDVT